MAGGPPAARQRAEGFIRLFGKVIPSLICFLVRGFAMLERINGGSSGYIQLYKKRIGPTSMDWIGLDCNI